MLKLVLICDLRDTVPDINVAITWTLVFEWYVARCGSKNGHHKGMCFERNWIMGSKYVHHSRFNSQHIWEGRGECGYTTI